MDILRKCLFAAAAICLLSFFTACGYYEAKENRSKMAQIRLGMTREQVTEIMGEPPRGTFQEKNVVFYYSDPKWYDGLVTRDECTPFVFDAYDGRLIGSGYEYYNKNYSLADWSQQAIDSTIK